MRRAAERSSRNTSRTCELAKRYNPDLLAVSFLMPDLPGDFNRRRYIRETWVADAMQLDRRSNFCDSLHAQPVHDDRAVCIDFRFLIGVDDYNAVAAEARLHQDSGLASVRNREQPARAQDDGGLQLGAQESRVRRLRREDRYGCVRLPATLRAAPSPCRATS